MTEAEPIYSSLDILPTLRTLYLGRDNFIFYDFWNGDDEIPLLIPLSIELEWDKEGVISGKVGLTYRAGPLYTVFDGELVENLWHSRLRWFS